MAGGCAGGSGPASCHLVWLMTPARGVSLVNKPQSQDYDMPEYIGTGGCSTSPPLCGCVLNISEGKEKYAHHQTRYILGDVDHSNAA